MYRKLDEKTESTGNVVTAAEEDCNCNCKRGSTENEKETPAGNHSQTEFANHYEVHGSSDQ